MRNRLLIVFFVVACAMSACTVSGKRGDALSIDACKVGSACVVTGELRIHPGQPVWGALVVSGDRCVKLALPDDFYTEAKPWNGSAVEVGGQAFEQPAFDDSSGIIMLWYTERDRKVSLGMCDGGVGLYVDTMRARKGLSWPHNQH